MDPISQATLGAVLPQAVLRHEKIGRLVLCGALAGLAPDLDVLITSDTDPLLFLVFHRPFTHSLIFIPIGALIVASGCLLFFRKTLAFKDIYLACLLGYATHGLLDACTSYGTQLLWPFTDYRFSWNSVSVVDPAFTLPVLILVIVGTIWRKRWIAWLGLAWAISYLSLGFVQSQRALDAGMDLAALREHEPQRLTIKPSMANVLVWKVLYEHDDVYYVDAVRVGLTGDKALCGTGSHIEKLKVERDLPWLAESQQLVDVGRFSWFSQDYVAMDPVEPNRIIDVRSSVLPNQISPLWGIDLDPQANENDHVKFVSMRSVSERQIGMIRSFLSGEECPLLSDFESKKPFET